MVLFLIFAPFGSVLPRFVSGVGDLVGLFGPFFCCLFAICTGRETSGSLFPVFAPLWAVLSRFWYPRRGTKGFLIYPLMDANIH